MAQQKGEKMPTFEGQLALILVEPQPTYIESSGRWHWPLPERAHFEGCCTSVVTASREWWEYAPAEAKPHANAKALQYNEKWYWVAPIVRHPAASEELREIVSDIRKMKVTGEPGVVDAVTKGVNWIADRIERALQSVPSDAGQPEVWPGIQCLNFASAEDAKRAEKLFNDLTDEVERLKAELEPKAPQPRTCQEEQD